MRCVYHPNTIASLSQNPLKWNKHRTYEIHWVSHNIPNLVWVLYYKQWNLHAGPVGGAKVYITDVSNTREEHSDHEQNHIEINLWGWTTRWSCCLKHSVCLLTRGKNRQENLCFAKYLCYCQCNYQHVWIARFVPVCQHVWKKYKLNINFSSPFVLFINTL